DDDRLAGTAIGHDIGSTFRSVVDILRLVDIQQDGNEVGISDCHHFLFRRPVRDEDSTAVILTCHLGLVHRHPHLIAPIYLWHFGPWFSLFSSEPYSQRGPHSGRNGHGQGTPKGDSYGTRHHRRAAGPGSQWGERCEKGE